MMPNSVIRDLFNEFKLVQVASSRSLFADGSPVWIYGAGNVGKDVHRLLVKQGVSVLGFLDRQAKPGLTYKGIPIYAPDDPRIVPSQRREGHVVIAIFNAYADIPPIVSDLENLGYGRVTSFLEVHDQFSQELGDRFWLTSRAYYHGLEQQAAQGYEIWSDQISRDLYAKILRFRLLKEYDVLPAPDWEGQYFPNDLPAWQTPLRFVDCGAFDGDTLRQVFDAKIPLEAVAAFEPDPVNFVKLTDIVRTLITDGPEATSLFPCGVDVSTSQVRFSSGQGAGSHASATGDAVIQCVSIDEALPTFRPNLIKMDIEGAELNALWGARRTIATYRPGLAICLYHCPAHLWQIPLLILQLTGGGGKYFLRSHRYNGFDLVLYWLPE